MYHAKDAGRNTYRFFTERMNDEAVAYLRIRSGLQRALEKREFVLFYQPQIDLASGTVTGAEALIRWIDPDQGMIAPGRFIPIAEDSGQIVAIGEWVLLSACRQASLWRNAGFPAISLAVNLSALQLTRGDIERTITAALDETGLPPETLELELTESM